MAPAGDDLALIAEAFDREYYLQAYLDVAQAGVDPLRHYVSHGWREKRRPAAWFDPEYYLAANPDAAGGDPFAHYLAHGRAAGRAASAPGG